MSDLKQDQDDEKHPDGPPDHPDEEGTEAPPAYASSSHSSAGAIESKTSIPRLPLHVQSSFGAPPPRPPSTYASISLTWDKLRMIGFPKDLISPVDAVIRRVWTQGIKEHKVDDVSGSLSASWKFVGWPWSNLGSAVITSRRVLAHVLYCLAEHGWHLLAATDICRSGFDKDTLIFRLSPSTLRYIFSITFSSSDRIRIIDPPTEDVRVAFELAVRGAWALGVQEAKEKEAGTYQLKVVGSPFSAIRGEQLVQNRVMAMALLSAMEAEGYDLLGSVGMTSGSDDTSGLDTWFFVQK